MDAACEDAELVQLPVKMVLQSVAARVSSLALLPQGKVEGARRAKAMVAKMDELVLAAVPTPVPVNWSEPNRSAFHI